LWDSRFLHDDGSSSGQGSTSVLPPDVASGMLSDLTNVGDHGGHWTPDNDKGRGADLPYDGRGHGSVGGVDEHGKPHHHDLWKPNH